MRKLNPEWVKLGPSHAVDFIVHPAVKQPVIDVDLEYCARQGWCKFPPPSETKPRKLTPARIRLMAKWKKIKAERRAANVAAGLTCNGQPRKYKLRGHVLRLVELKSDS